MQEPAWNISGQDEVNEEELLPTGSDPGETQDDSERFGHVERQLHNHFIVYTVTFVSWVQATA